MTEKSLYDALKDRFTIVNLGCIADRDFTTPTVLRAVQTVVEVDAGGAAVTGTNYHRKVAVQNIIRGKRCRSVFRRNAFVGTSSALPPNESLIRAYGNERYFRKISEVEVDCETLPDLLLRNNIKNIDFLKTDLEGVDFEVLQSCEDYLGKILCIQCELRFEPLYQGEPFFHDVVKFLQDRGYELFDITHIDRWKYKTPHRSMQVEGRAVWGDFLFFLHPDKIASHPDGAALAAAKMILIASIISKKNYAEFLLARFESVLPGPWRDELAQIVKPRFYGITYAIQRVRRWLFPLEMTVHHLLGRNHHVAIR